MYSGAHFQKFESDPVVLICVFVFLVAITVFLLNMLVAQLTCAYEAVYADMIGYARLERIEIIVGIMPVVSQRRWMAFLESLKLDTKVEFNAGDVGVTGGIQILEPANANPTTMDMIKRFGGSTSVEMQWPVEQEGQGDEADRFERLENMIQKTLKRITKGGSGGGKRAGGSGTGGSGTGSNDMDDDGEVGGSGKSSSDDEAGQRVMSWALCVHLKGLQFSSL